MNVADAVQLTGSDEFLTLQQPNTEDHRVRSPLNRLEPLGVRTFRDGPVWRIRQDLVPIINPAEHVRQIASAQWRQCHMLAQHTDDAIRHRSRLSYPGIMSLWFLVACHPASAARSS